MRVNLCTPEHDVGSIERLAGGVLYATMNEMPRLQLDRDFRGGVLRSGLDLLQRRRKAAGLHDDLVASVAFQQVVQ